jgi:hypothetical protein
MFSPFVDIIDELFFLEIKNFYPAFISGTATTEMDDTQKRAAIFYLHIGKE